LIFGYFNCHAEEEKDVKIAPGDVMEIFVWNNEDLSRQVQITMDGNIALPMVGNVKAQGLTTKELSIKLEEKFGKYIKHSKISVIFVKHTNWMVYIFGSIQRSGEYNYYNGMKLSQLCIKANGFRDNADISTIRIIRDMRDGKKKHIDVNLSKILNGTAPDIKLQIKDVVYIPKTSISSWNVFISEVVPSLNFIATLVVISALF
ncbi:MAG: polysaccharide biosynthesis/export family protein, partial [Elusimicrobia bacterium]|nr:polysaccharide biosynthesis/export family protein [Elusimicrobiota bacterium]